MRLSNVMRINVNAGWLWDRLADIHYATYAAGIDWRTPDNVWTVTAEVFGVVGDADTPSGKQPRAENVLARREAQWISAGLAVFEFRGSGGLVRRQRGGETFLGGILVKV